MPKHAPIRDTAHENSYAIECACGLIEVDTTKQRALNRMALHIDKEFKKAEAIRQQAREAAADLAYPKLPPRRNDRLFANADG